jgi:hypothetical protein
MNKTVDFACKVAEQVTDVPFDLIRAAYNDNENLEVLNAANYQAYGIDPATIIALITAIIQIIELMRNNCNKPKQFAENARIRNPLLLAVFRARVRVAANRVGYTGSVSKLTDAFLDVAHSSGERAVSEVLDELKMI